MDEMNRRPKRHHFYKWCWPLSLAVAKLRKVCTIGIDATDYVMEILQFSR
jgi:hypothetical protein